MKTKSLAPILFATKQFLGVLLPMLLALPMAHGAAATAELFEKGIYTEETRGELKSAVQIYQQIIDDPRTDRSLLAQAQLRLGLCQLKLGNKPQAISALDRLTQEFPDKDRLLTIVEQHMPRMLDEIVQQIERNYIQEVDRGELMETAIRAIVGKLDSRGGLLRTNEMEFLGADEMKQMNEQLDQQLAGIGTALKTNAGGIVVQSVFPGSPAFEGGLHAGDYIVSINGAPLPETKPLATAVQLLRGPAGTPVTVGVTRGGTEDVREFKLVRNIIRLPSALGDHRIPDGTWEFMMDNPQKLGYIRLTSVGRQSAEEMRTALESLHARGMKALVLDLRNNPGGLLDGAVAISDLFVDSGRILTVKGRNGETVYDATANGKFSRFPVALLVNHKTASAGEIVAACLQDHHRAVVIGERTAGHGIVRSVYQLKSGVGAMKLPIAAYYRPNGKPMNRYPGSKDGDDWGVSPDPGYEIALTDEEMKQIETEREARNQSVEAPPATAFQDRQLQKALEWLQSQIHLGK